MAESIYTQLENFAVITPVDGKDYSHPLPSGLFPTVEQFESPDQLITWADDNDLTAKLIQKGLQKGIIEVRACFKSCKKDKVWTESMGLANVDKLEWKDVTRPNVKKSDESVATDYLSKLSPEERAKLIASLG